jgi:hypothetical protein
MTSTKTAFITFSSAHYGESATHPIMSIGIPTMQPLCQMIIPLRGVGDAIVARRAHLHEHERVAVGARTYRLPIVWSTSALLGPPVVPVECGRGKARTRC